MKRLFAFFTCLLLSASIMAQAPIGNQLPMTVRITSYGSTQNALISLPDDYTLTNEKYPLILFLHGYGEIGNSIADLPKLIKQGLPKVIADGKKIQAVKDGKVVKFIVISPQHWGWTTEPASIDYMLKNLPNQYRIDTNRIYITGLSAGGQGVVQSVTYSQALTNKIAAIVPMSPSAPDNSFVNKFKYFAESKTGAWFFSGGSDTGPYTANANRYNDSINKYNPGGSKITIYNGGHCCWSTYYDPTYKLNGQSIYDWMLTNVKGVNTGTPPDTVKPEPPKIDTLKLGCVGCSITYTDIKNVRKAILLNKDGSYTEIDSTLMEKLIELH